MYGKYLYVYQEGSMAKDASFDIVSEVNTEEVKNAIQQTIKELSNRFDFKIRQ